ncbi:MAG: ABC transporter ATP-binding protein [Chlorobi bacterium]|nr:ABC transporter ATP-binding protein [Chlorobiota bacterium]
MQKKPVVEIKGVSKKLGSIQAVDKLDMCVYENDIYGFLGPNGSGKSTTIRMMLALLSRDSGSINIFGKPLDKNRDQILGNMGAFIEKPDFYEYLTAYKNLELLCKYSGVPAIPDKINATLESVGLLDRANSKVKTFSKGMKQRLGIGQTLLHDPDLLILDEPTSGLDPSGVKDIRDLIRSLNRDKGKTIILSSHQLQDIEMTANRMCIINKGKLIVEGDVGELLMKHSYFTVFEVDQIDSSVEVLESSGFEIEIIGNDRNQIKVVCKREIVPEINKILVNNNIAVKSIGTKQNLEDYFLTLT